MGKTANMRDPPRSQLESRRFQGNAMTSSDTDPLARDAPGREGPRDGDAIKLGRHVVSGVNGGRPLVMEFEARIVTGPGAGPLAWEQAVAIREVLAWIASRQQSPDAESGDDNADT